MRDRDCVCDFVENPASSFKINSKSFDTFDLLGFRSPADDDRSVSE